MTLQGDPRSSRPTFYELRHFVVKQGWENNSKEEGENTQYEKRLSPRPGSDIIRPIQKIFTPDHNQNQASRVCKLCREGWLW